MFIGHYSAAFAVKAAKPEIPLWHLFIAVQLVDYAWAILLLLGIEQVRITPGFMEASSLDLFYMPYTHSLIAAVVWMTIGGCAYALFSARLKEQKNTIAIAMGLAVGSHWLLDLIVHSPDLSLFPSEAKVGLGLWGSLFWSQFVEIGLLFVAAGIYAYRCSSTTLGNVSLAGLLVFMAIVQWVNVQPEQTPSSTTALALSALLGYTLFAGAAWLTERQRVEPVL